MASFWAPAQKRLAQLQQCWCTPLQDIICAGRIKAPVQPHGARGSLHGQQWARHQQVPVLHHLQVTPIPHSLSRPRLFLTFPCKNGLANKLQKISELSWLFPPFPSGPVNIWMASTQSSESLWVSYSYILKRYRYTLFTFLIVFVGFFLILAMWAMCVAYLML